MKEKLIINKCYTGHRCTLEIDGRYFGYDSTPAYPETTYSGIEDAHWFKCPKDALEVTTWYSGEVFIIEPVKK